MSRERLIVALDHPDAKRALAQVDELGDSVERYPWAASGRSYWLIW